MCECVQPIFCWFDARWSHANNGSYNHFDSCTIFCFVLYSFPFSLTPFPLKWCRLSKTRSNFTVYQFFHQINATNENCKFDYFSLVRSLSSSRICLWWWLLHCILNVQCAISNETQLYCKKRRNQFHCIKCEKTEFDMQFFYFFPVIHLFMLYFIRFTNTFSR